MNFYGLPEIPEVSARAEESHLGKLKKKKDMHLTFEQVCEIRKLGGEGWSKKDLAKKFNRDLTCINNILSFRTYKYGRI